MAGKARNIRCLTCIFWDYELIKIEKLTNSFLKLISLHARLDKLISHRSGCIMYRDKISNQWLSRPNIRVTTFRKRSHDAMVTFAKRVWGLERVVEDMARDLSLSSNIRRGSNYMMGFEESGTCKVPSVLDVVTAGIEATTSTRVVLYAENNHTATLANGRKSCAHLYL
ncbi:Armadillo-like helical [Artemisia annua]|uniref:Armadillo-like helical n=1 Tax=Artemisia annua TaxID=35608 RepID=A0A2U1Q4U8_ARTAN|nr:Armadillo-like helical [Artemisia annua]